MLQKQTLMKSKKQTKLITGIHSYCDNWCERCPFTQRCAVGVAEMDFTDAQENNNNEAFWRNISQTFTQTLQLLTQDAENNGFKLEPPTEEELIEFERKDTELRATMAENPLIVASKYYAKQVATWFKAHDKTFEEKGFELIKHIDMGITTEAEMLEQGLAFGNYIEVVQWYRHLIFVKFSRALHGKIEDDGWEVENGFQKDSDGSAKIALICAEKSLAAWAKLAALLPDFADDMLPILGNLQKIIRLGDLEFPDARAFVRAGFDD